MRALSPSASLIRRLPLVAVLIFAACLCLAAASPSVTTELASSSSGSADSIPVVVGEDAIAAASSSSDGVDSEESSAAGAPTNENTVATNDGAASNMGDVAVDAGATSYAADVATDAGVSITRSKDVAVESASATSSKEAAADADESEDDGAMALTPIPTAAAGSSTFASVPAVTCDTKTVDTIESVCSINRAMFDACVAKSGYQIFPYSGVAPTVEDITGLVNSESCMGFIMAVVLLDMPACTVAQMPLRAVCETLLKISVDMEDGEAAPSAAEFHEQMAWRRDSDLAKQAGEPYDNQSAIYADFTRNLRVALTESKVTVLSNLTILIEDYEGEEIDMADGAEAAFDMSLDYDLVTVEAADSNDGQQRESDAASDSGNQSVSALSSDARSTASGSMVMAVALAVAAHALVVVA